MFNPNEWKQTNSTHNGSPVYENKQTGLPKLRNSFTREQQRLLDIHRLFSNDVQIWTPTEYRRDE